MSRAIILTVDGLGAKHLGPYGNTWIDTPAFNHLAVASLLFENMYVPFDDPYKSLAALLRGGASLASQVPELAHESLLSWLATEGTVTQLLTDDADFMDLELTADFVHQMDVIEAPPSLALASEWDETHAASFFAQAVRAVEQMPNEALLWLHTKGLGNPWDAPYAYRAEFADEDDPEPTGSAQVPMLALDPDYDPDTVHEIRCALAGQITLIDQCLGVLLSVVQELRDDGALFVVTSPRGFPLGEHLQIGWKTAVPYPELFHVPGFVRFPDRRQALRRTEGLGEPLDLTREIVQWFSGKMRSAPERIRDWSVSRCGNDWLLRTTSWHVNVPAEPSQAEFELYLKPDDQNEVNNVATRCPNVIDAAQRLMCRFTDGGDVATKQPLEVRDREAFQVLWEPPE